MRISLLFGILFCSVSLFSQVSFKSIKGELKGLSSSKYINKCLEGAEQLKSQREYDDVIDLLSMAHKKARSISPATQGVVDMTCAEFIHNNLPREEKYQKKIVDYIEDVVKTGPSEDILDRARALSARLGQVYSHKDLTKVRGQIDDLLIVTKENESAQIQKKKMAQFSDLKKEEAFQEFERLKQEREALEVMRKKLAKTVTLTEKKLNSRTAQINRMTKDNAKKEALLQFRMRMIDSLQFLAQLDSMNIINNELIINQQEDQLNLQQSELALKESEIQLKNSQQKLYVALAVLGLFMILGLLFFAWNSKRINKSLALKNQQIEEEKERSEELLLNILPKFIAKELKENDKVETKLISQCTVLFTDFINFSNISKQLTPQELIGALDECFREFDQIISKYGIEKIKTIGDSYMCAGGVPIPNKSHAVDAVNAAFEMVRFLNEWNDQREKDNKVRFDARIGIHTGPIIAGVVGIKKFAYDIWGDTVNVASRLESSSSAQKINVSATTYQLIKDYYECTSRGSLDVKNMKAIEMYYVDSVRPSLKTA